MDEDFPRSADEFTNAWLSRVLGAPVAGFETCFLEGGVLSDAYKLQDIRYETPAPGAPRSVVVKLSLQEQERRQAATGSNAYIKELNFFRQLAADLPLRTPRVFATFSDGSDDAEFFVIVMEELTTHSKVFDQVDDPPDEAFTRKIALEAAKLHARSERTHTHGAIRKVGVNLMVPVGLLLLRLRDILLRKPSAFPFEPVGEDAMPRLKEVMKEVEQLGDSLAVATVPVLSKL
jgi:hypothetical protein